MKFRSPDLPAPGRLFMHSMPGQREPLVDVLHSVQALDIRQVFCLAPMDEIKHKSPEYYSTLSDKLSCDITMLPIPDFGVPTDVAAFWGAIDQIATTLRAGANVLVHCAGGIGRTGTVAVGVAIRLGMTHADALAAVKAEGSGPETSQQRALVSRLPI